jgi:hypothetical protein
MLATRAVPEYLSEHPELACDLVHIDGGHFDFTPWNDLVELARSATPVSLSLNSKPQSPSRSVTPSLPLSRPQSAFPLPVTRQAPPSDFPLALSAFTRSPLARSPRAIPSHPTAPAPSAPSPSPDPATERATRKQWLLWTTRPQ